MKSSFIMLFLNNLFYFYCRFAVFRRCLDAEMKDSSSMIKGVLGQPNFSPPNKRNTTFPPN